MKHTMYLQRISERLAAKIHSKSYQIAKLANTLLLLLVKSGFFKIEIKCYLKFDHMLDLLFHKQPEKHC